MHYAVTETENLHWEADPVPLHWEADPVPLHWEADPVALSQSANQKIKNLDDFFFFADPGPYPGLTKEGS